jgi:hypothetical protein
MIKGGEEGGKKEEGKNSDNGGAAVEGKMFHVGSLIFTLFWSRTLIYCSLVLLG